MRESDAGWSQERACAGRREAVYSLGKTPLEQKSDILISVIFLLVILVILVVIIVVVAMVMAMVLVVAAAAASDRRRFRAR
jgi:hypothetical protein